ncbi:MAG TPA: hypothetical protein VMZ26_14565 [Pyrinomonadaceae bacterium]|nr:hypothetical protein [Pyrinomonadaceae bacterium]
MINHISIAVNDPERVANVIAELWDGMVFPFPPAPNSFFVVANDGRGSAVEITPAGTVLIPGDGLPDENDLDGATEVYEAKFVQSELRPKYVATHLNINTKKSIDEIREIAKREGWRVLVCNRGEGLFQLVEVWVENTFMLEVMTPEQTASYVEITNPEFMVKAFAGAFDAHVAASKAAENLNVIG